MTKYTSITIVALALSISVLSASANAQTIYNADGTINTTGTSTTTSGTNRGTGSGAVSTMITLYNQSGTPVNTGTGRLAAGWYYMASGNPVYYYGNGTYYDPAIQQYGGNVNNPNGTAGAVLSSGSGSATGSVTTTPGAPNTGLGGDALFNWLALILSGGVLAGSVFYLNRRATAI